MHCNFGNKIAILVILVLASLAVNAQLKDTLPRPDVIIRVDGSIMYGRVLEVNQQVVKYQINDMVTGPVIIIPRNLVYAISYSNNTTQIITPLFNQKTISVIAFDQSNNQAGSSAPRDTSSNLKHNLAHGSIKVGLGFYRGYSGIKGINNFNRSASSPSIYAAYLFRFNRFLITGVSLGYASFNYNYSRFSEYDQVSISQNITEAISTLGLFGRYNLMDGFIKPYLMMGLNVNYCNAFIKSDISFIDEGKHIITNTNIRGFKTNFVFRGGVDFMISRTFGLYGDIGTGTSLIQLGVIFSLK
jgi:hypothetical protein